MGRRTLLLITSVLLAAVGTAIVAVYVRGADDRAAQNQATASFVVARQEIAAGATIRAQDVGIRPMRAADQPGTTATSLESVIGKRVTTDVLAGTTIDTRVFTRPGAEIDGAAVRPGELGVNVQLQDPNRAVSLLGVGSWVRIFTLQGDRAVEVVRKARVVSIGAELEPSGAEGPDGQNDVGAGPVPAAVVGLSVRQSSAEKIMAAQMQQQPMYFALIPSADVLAQS